MWQLIAPIEREALAISQKVLRKFPSNPEGTQCIDREGLVAEVRLDTSPFRVALFFTSQHPEAWNA